ELLKAIADHLLERETLDRDEIYMLARGEALPPAQSLDVPLTPEPETRAPTAVASSAGLTEERRRSPDGESFVPAAGQETADADGEEAADVDPRHAARGPASRLSRAEAEPDTSR
ncbi:MAG: hypothetical protein ACRELV_11855, partial [Longimicrobiales bacterium]